jgi:hypothetical protein
MPVLATNGYCLSSCANSAVSARGRGLLDQAPCIQGFGRYGDFGPDPLAQAGLIAPQGPG